MGELSPFLVRYLEHTFEHADSGLESRREAALVGSRKAIEQLYLDFAGSVGLKFPPKTDAQIIADKLKNEGHFGDDHRIAVIMQKVREAGNSAAHPGRVFSPDDVNDSLVMLCLAVDWYARRIGAATDWRTKVRSGSATLSPTPKAAKSNFRTSGPAWGPPPPRPRPMSPTPQHQPRPLPSPRKPQPEPKPVNLSWLFNLILIALVVFVAVKVFQHIDGQVCVPGLSAEQCQARRQGEATPPTSIRPDPQYSHTLNLTSDSWSPWIILPQGYAWRFCDASRSASCDESEPSTYHYEARTSGGGRAISQCSTDGCRNIHRIRFRANGAPVTLRYSFTAPAVRNESFRPPPRAGSEGSPSPEKLAGQRERASAARPDAARAAQAPNPSRGSQVPVLQDSPPAVGSVLCMLPSLDQVRISERLCRERGGSFDVEAQ